MWFSATLSFVLFAVAVVSGRHLDRSGLRVRESPSTRGGRLGIYDGTNTTIEAHPYMVSITALDSIWCAGVIVSNSWVLTVASWLSIWSAESYTLIVGSNSSNTGGLQYTLKQYVLHPDFDPSQNDYDFACAQIDGTFNWSTAVKPIKLPTTEVIVNDMYQIVGWGSRENYGVSPVLVQGEMKVVQNSVCNHYYTEMSSFNFMNETMVCVYNKGKTTACSDDQGDPFIKNGVIYGQVSISQVCSGSAGPVVMSNIPLVTSWIINTTGASYEDE